MRGDIGSFPTLDRLGEDLRRAFAEANPEPIAYTRAAHRCLELADEAISSGNPIRAREWFAAAREGLETAYKIQELAT